MTAYKGSLWVGTSNGFVLTLPLPRLEGVPQIKGDGVHAVNSYNASL